MEAMSPALPDQQQPVETYESLAMLVDYHLLEPTLSTEQVAHACDLAREYGVRAVVVRPCDAQLVVQSLRGSGITVASVAGYPDGTSTTAAKLYEGRDMLRAGVTELEFVLNPANMLSRSFQHVETELMQISRSCHEDGAKLTVVYNNRWFADDLKIIGTKICRRNEVDRLSIDHSDADLAVFRPMLKDVLTLKRATPVASLEDAIAAKEAGYTSFATTQPQAILDAWKAHLAEQAKAS
jgi:deoxyribose-phosphate aldolase